MEVLKVSSHSSPNSVAGAIAGVIREKKVVEVQAVGAGAANQAIKAIAIARGYLAPIGVGLEALVGSAGTSAVINPGPWFRFTTVVSLLGGTMFIVCRVT